MLIRRRLRGNFKYDKVTGIVTTSYKVSMRTEGHMRVHIDRDTSYRMVEVIYAYVKGKLPEYAKIVQLNGNKLDFSFNNLALDNSKMLEHVMRERGGFDFDRDINKRIPDA